MTDVAPSQNDEVHMDDIGRTEAVKEAVRSRQPKKVTMRLLRNYRPVGEFDVVGYLRPAVTVRDVTGKEKTIEPETFIKGEAAPPPQAGVGFSDKVWAGTFIKLSPDEAKAIKATGVGDVEID